MIGSSDVFPFLLTFYGQWPYALWWIFNQDIVLINYCWVDFILRYFSIFFCSNIINGYQISILYKWSFHLLSPINSGVCKCPCALILIAALCSTQRPSYLTCCTARPADALQWSSWCRFLPVVSSSSSCRCFSQPPQTSAVTSASFCLDFAVAVLCVEGRLIEKKNPLCKETKYFI